MRVRTISRGVTRKSTKVKRSRSRVRKTKNNMHNRTRRIPVNKSRKNKRTRRYNVKRAQIGGTGKEGKGWKIARLKRKLTQSLLTNVRALLRRARRAITTQEPNTIISAATEAQNTIERNPGVFSKNFGDEADRLIKTGQNMRAASGAIANHLENPTRKSPTPEEMGKLMYHAHTRPYTPIEDMDDMNDVD